MACLTELREQRGLTQLALSKQLGKYKTFVHKYETGMRKLNSTEWVEVVKILGGNPVEISKQIYEELD